MIQAPKSRRQSTESPYQAELRSAELNNQAEQRALGKCKTVFGFGLHFREWISRGETNRDQLDPAIRSKGQVADSVRGIDRASYQFPSARDVFRPRNYQRTE